MLETSNRARWAWVGALAVFGVASSAAAQEHLILDTSGTPTCVPSGNRPECGPGGVCGPEETCRVFGADDAHCFPNNTVFCCSDGTSSCPDAPYTFRCVPVSDLHASICLPGRDYCADAPSSEQIALCHSVEGSGARLPWGEGDCDRDGIPNGVEAAAGASWCDAPAPIEVYRGGECAPLAFGCTDVDAPCPSPDDTDRGTCEVTPDGYGTFCRPNERLLCCDEGLCPRESACVSVGHSVHLCAPVCLASSNRDAADCITTPDGSIVPARDGDCDRDGITNGEEQMRGTDPCIPDVSDAGAAREDAGAEHEDAGADAGSSSGADASASFDGGSAGTPPTFEGGGGCVCRAAPSAPSRGIAWLALLGFALLCRRRRRA